MKYPGTRAALYGPGDLIRYHPWRYWDPDGYTPEEWNQRLTGLMSRGLNLAEASLFAATAEYVEDLGDHIGLYRDRGFSTLEAFRWWVWDFNPDDATLYANAGWAPHQVDAIFRATDQHGTSANANTGQALVVAAWISSGIPAHRVITYAAAHIPPTEAHHLEHRRDHGENIDSLVETIAALLG